MEPVLLSSLPTEDGDPAHQHDNSTTPWGLLEYWPEPEFRASEFQFCSDSGLPAADPSDNSLLQQHPTISESQHMFSPGHDLGAEFTSPFDLSDQHQFSSGVLDPSQFMSSSGAGHDAYSNPGLDLMQQQLRGNQGQRGGGVTRQQNVGLPDFCMPNKDQHGFGNDLLDSLAGGNGLSAHAGSFPNPYSMSGNARQGV